MPPRPLILGTAGHIDHGKTALVRALTGVDTDRLAEEKQRGISIELGFAHLDLGEHRLGIVDVPGHERFIRNMLAGASGIDLALLVIAADDSVMPQTREHLAILELLHIPAGLVALTKSDLVEESWLELVEEEIRELTTNTLLDGAPIIRTSAVTGAGLDDLKRALANLCETVARPGAGEDVADVFRLPIDRAFVLQGLGTVVTGTVWSGSAALNDELELLPQGKTVRIRSIQSHGSDAETVGRGQRAAINLMGAHHSEIVRGCELATRDAMRPSQRLTVHLRALPSAPWPLRHRSRARLHVGTQEIMVEIRLLQGTAIEPGRNAFAQLLADEPVVASGLQPFVIRAESPLVTIGGGLVLQPNAARIRRRNADSLARLPDLASPDDRTRAAAAIWFQAHRPWTSLDLCRDARLSHPRADDLISSFEAEGLIVPLSLTNRTTRRLHRDVLADLSERVLATMSTLHAEAPLEAGIPRRRLAARLDYLPEDVVLGLVDRLVADGALVGDEQVVSLPDFQPALSEAQIRLRDAILDAYRAGGFSPPDPADLARQGNVSDAQLKPILDLCVSEGALVHIEGSMFMHARHHDELVRRVTEAMSDSPGLTMSEIRQRLDTTRKYAVPICEHLDRIGLTMRRGDVRVLRNPVAADTGSST